jgi:hypothetical protein
MRTRIALVAAAVAWIVGPALAAPVPSDALKKGTPTVKSVSALAFGPNGLLFIGDPQAATITAVDTGDATPGGKQDVNVENLGEKIGSALGTDAANVAVADMKVNPASGTIYFAVARGKGKDAAPVIVKMTRDGKVSEFALKDVPFAQVTIPNANDKQRQEAITSLAFVDGKVVVAGLSNEEFASTLRVLPYPFQEADKGTSVEVFHGNHGRLETQAPVRTFVPYKIGGADYILAAYTCTPLVRFPVSDLKPGQKVRGTTIAELGNMNKPLDMIVYTKDKQDYILMANNARGVMKIPTAEAATVEPITARVGGKAGLKYETIEELKGVVQLDKLDADRALVLIQDPPPQQGGKGQQPAPAGETKLILKSIPLP